MDLKPLVEELINLRSARVRNLANPSCHFQTRLSRKYGTPSFYPIVTLPTVTLDGSFLLMRYSMEILPLDKLSMMTRTRTTLNSSFLRRYHLASVNMFINNCFTF